MQVQNYLSRLSEPLLDRMDLCVEMEKRDFVFLGKTGKEETSEKVRERVMDARERQAYRYREEEIRYNSELDGKCLEKYCLLGKKDKILWKELCEQLELSARGAKRLLRVARTLADLAGREKVEEEHLFEASLYKGINQKYWNTVPDGKRGGEQ